MASMTTTITGCASINCQPMVKGQAYTFYFGMAAGGIFNASPQCMGPTIARDSNFLNPVASVTPTGSLKLGAQLSVSFIYNGEGSSVGQAGQEMQNLLNNFWMSAGLSTIVFSGAALGTAPASLCQNCCCKATIDFMWIIGILLALGVAAYFFLPGFFAAQAAKVSAQVP